MNLTSQSDIFAATRLTRQGNLAEATALLQRVARGLPSPRVSTETRTDTEGAVVSQPLSDAKTPVLPIPSRRAGGQATEAGKFLTQSYASDKGSRDYKLYIPAGYRGEPSPLIVMLHGCTQSADDFAVGTRMNSVAQEHGCLVAYPVQPASANQSRCWNWFNRQDQQRDRGEPSLIVGIVRQISRDYCVDPRRIYVAGLSAGGAAAAVLAMEYPELFAAVGVHSGVACGVAHDLPSAFAAMRGTASGSGLGAVGVRGQERQHRMPTIVFHGDCDTTVHPSNSDRIIASTRTAGLSSTTETSIAPGGRGYTRRSYADETGRELLELWIVHGAGHAWSGGSRSGSYTDPAGPDASREMMRFFLAHQR